MNFKAKKLLAYLLTVIMVFQIMPLTGAVAAAGGHLVDIESNGIQLSASNYYVVVQTKSEQYDKKKYSDITDDGYYFVTEVDDPVVLLKQVDDGDDPTSRAGTVLAVYPSTTTSATGVIENHPVTIDKDSVGDYHVKISSTSNNPTTFDVQIGLKDYSNNWTSAPLRNGTKYYLFVVSAEAGFNSARSWPDNSPWHIEDITTSLTNATGPINISISTFSNEQNQIVPDSGHSMSYSSFTDTQRSNLKARIISANEAYSLAKIRNMSESEITELFNKGIDGFAPDANNSTEINPNGSVDWTIVFNQSIENRLSAVVKYPADMNEATLINEDMYIYFTAATQSSGTAEYVVRLDPRNILKTETDGENKLAYFALGDTWYNNHPYSDNWTVSAVLIKQKDGQQHLSDGAVPPNDNNYEVQKTVLTYDVSGPVKGSSEDAANHILYSTYTMTLTPGNYVVGPTALTPESILGSAAEFGIVANRFEQSGHTETNFAVNYFDNGKENIDIGGAGSNAIPIYVGNIADKLWISQNTNVDVDIYCPQSEWNKVEDTSANHVTHWVPKSTGEVSTYVSSLISAGKEKSNALKSTTPTITYTADNYTRNIDTHMYPDNCTIYINCTDDVTKEGTWTILKRPGQSIVFNVSGTNVTINKFKVTTCDEDGNEIESIDTVTDATDYSGSGTTRNKLVDKLILEHITFNAYEAENLKLETTAGLFLAPNASYVEQKNGAGWILAEGTVNSKSEWHFYRHKRHYHSAGETGIIARKMLTDPSVSLAGKDISYTLYACDSNYENRVQLGDPYTPGSTGRITFPKFSYNSDTDEIPQGGSKTFYYVIVENDPSAEGRSQRTTDHYWVKDDIIYNASEKKLRVVARDDGNENITITLYLNDSKQTEVDGSYDIGGFVNSVQKVIAHPEVTKQFDYWDLAESFTFELKAGNNDAGVDTPMPEDKEKDGKITATATQEEPTAVFDDITFHKVGTYHYTITEIDGGIPEIQYDTTPHGVTITVTECEITEKNPGGLQAVVTYDDDNKPSLTITNERKTSQVKIKKTFVNHDVPEGFTILATYGDESLTLTTGDDSDIAASGSNPYEWTITGLPTETKVTFVESGYEDGLYTVTTEKKSDTDEGFTIGTSVEATAKDGETRVAELKNTYIKNTYTELKATKDLKDWADGTEFTFTLKPDGNAPMPKETVNSKVKKNAKKDVPEVNFGEITYTLTDLAGATSKDFKYTIQETVPSNAKNANGTTYGDNPNKEDGPWVLKGVTYDEKPHNVTVTVVLNDDHTLTATPHYEGNNATQIITNTYDANGEVVLGGTKTIDGRLIKDGDELTVTAYVGENVKDFENAAVAAERVVTLTPFIGKDKATYTLPKISYALDQVHGAGGTETFKYTVVEKAKMAGTTVTIGKHNVAVTVTDNYTGVLNISVKVDGNTVTPNDQVFGGIDFLNTYHTEADTVITAKKELKGLELEDGAFTFTLKGKINDKLPEVNQRKSNEGKDDESLGIVTFDALMFAVNPTDDQKSKGYINVDDLPLNDAGHYEFKLVLAEDTKDLDKKDIRLEGADHYDITVNVDYNKADGKLTVSITPDDVDFKFTNIKNAKTEVKLEATKVMLGRDLKGQDFRFTLKNKDPKLNDDDPYYVVDQEASNNVGGEVKFNELKFAVNPTTEQKEKEGYFDITNLLDANNQFKLNLLLDEDLEALKAEPAVIPVSPMREDGTMGYDVTITLTYDAKYGTLKAKAEPENGKMVFINRVVKARKRDIADQHELEGAEIEIYIKDETKPENRGEFVTKFISGKTDTEIEGLKAGVVYILHEKVAPNGYLITADTEFKIDSTTGKVVRLSGTMTPDEILLVEDTMKKVSASIIKYWDDDNNRDAKRPKAIEVELQRRTEGVDPEDTTTIQTVTLNGENHWTATVDKLPAVDKECRNYIYSWKEPAAGDGYKLTSNKATSGTLTTLTNTHEVEKVPVSVKKVWADDDNKNGKRPASIEVQLYADGQAVGTPVTLDASNSWTYDWGEMPKNVNVNGIATPIVYSVAETKIPDGYICKVSGGTTTGFVITNTYENGKLIIEKEFDIKPWEPYGPNDEPMDIPVIKTWDDNGNKDGNRPESVTVRLFANGAEVATAQLTKDNGWRYTFTGMPRLDENKAAIKYTISEDPVMWYSAEINGFNIRNIYEPELINVWVHKEWEDNFNATNQRPESIVMTLNNGMRVVLSPENNWTAGIYNLPTRVNGQPIEYKWTEQRVLGYDKISEDVNGNTTTITNRVWHRNTAAPTGGKAPKTAGEAVYVFDDYETPLGVEIVINHVGDCFD